VSAIAEQLGLTASEVTRIDREVCTTVVNGQNPAETVASGFRNARIRQMTGLNAFVHFLVETCQGLDSGDANFVSGAALNVVLEHEFGIDRVGPVVEIYRANSQFIGNGESSVTAWFHYFDPGRVSTCDVKLWYDGRWHPEATPGCVTRTAIVPSGVNYAWAYRATDLAGHQSQWALWGIPR
jgi:hypothetical protein